VVSVLIPNPLDYNLFKITILTTANPGAGNNVTITSPTTGRTELLNLSFELDTDANAANRLAYLEFRRGVTHMRIGSAIGLQVASKTYHYIVSQGGAMFPTGTFHNLYIPIASLPILGSTDTIELIIENIQATDAITAIYSAWKAWPYEAV
jgi:hypothetical protein